MNTSIEQLKNTYAGIDKDDHGAVIRELVRASKIIELEAELTDNDADAEVWMFAKFNKQKVPLYRVMNICSIQ